MTQYPSAAWLVWRRPQVGKPNVAISSQRIIDIQGLFGLQSVRTWISRLKSLDRAFFLGCAAEAKTHNCRSPRATFHQASWPLLPFFGHTELKIDQFIDLHMIYIYIIHIIYIHYLYILYIYIFSLPWPWIFAFESTCIGTWHSCPITITGGWLAFGWKARDQSWDLRALGRPSRPSLLQPVERCGEGPNKHHQLVDESKNLEVSWHCW